jgi:hypothetical protein
MHDDTATIEKHLVRLHAQPAAEMLSELRGMLVEYGVMVRTLTTAVAGLRVEVAELRRDIATIGTEAAVAKSAIRGVDSKVDTIVAWLETVDATLTQAEPT